MPRSSDLRRNEVTVPCLIMSPEVAIYPMLNIPIIYIISLDKDICSQGLSLLNVNRRT